MSIHHKIKHAVKSIYRAVSANDEQLCLKVQQSLSPMELYLLKKQFASPVWEYLRRAGNPEIANKNGRVGTKASTEGW